MKSTSKHFVCFLFKGEEFDTTKVFEISSRKIEESQIPNGAYSYYFFDLEDKVLEDNVHARSSINLSDLILV